MIEPIQVFPKEKGYGIISGQRRIHAYVQLGKTSIPTVIENVDEDTAVIKMVDSNLHRNLLTSERAFAYRMKLDVIMRKKGLPPLPEDQLEFTEQQEQAIHEIISSLFGEKAKQVEQYICLTYLYEKILPFVDAKKIEFSVAIELSYINVFAQWWFVGFSEQGLLSVTWG